MARSMFPLVWPRNGLLVAVFVIGFVWIAPKYQPRTITEDTFSKGSTSPNFNQVEKEIRKRYNLVDGSPKEIQECTVESMNANKLEQDHPCVLEIIRSKFMNPPAARNEPYQFGDIEKIKAPDERPLLDTLANHLLKNKRNGFYFEAGAHDGMYHSNTLKFEQDYNYTGLLVEANPTVFKKLVARKRKAWTLPMCVSMEVFPNKVEFLSYDSDRAALGYHIVEKDSNGNKIFDKNYDTILRNGSFLEESVEVQCFPVYSILLAANRTCIDYFGLDVEGSEIRVLNTIPWDRVDFKVMRIEFLRVVPANNLTKEQVLQQYMEGEPGYTKYASINSDSIYFKDYINIKNRLNCD